MKSRLLVSVRSREEARLALDGGADLIDVKEPAHGSLGRAGDDVISAVIEEVAASRPVSAALGELIDSEPVFAQPGLTFGKWGLAGCHPHVDWRSLLHSGPYAFQSVYVAYADWQCAKAPPVDDVITLAIREPRNVLLIDTHCKTARANLLDWLGINELRQIRAACSDAGVSLALAGSLGVQQIAILAPLAPEWFAVRGAVCEQGERGRAIDAQKVRDLKRFLDG